MFLAVYAPVTRLPYHDPGQLCWHAAKIGIRLESPHGNRFEKNDVRVSADWTKTTEPSLSRSGGHCHLTATPEALIARIDAADVERLRTIQEIVGSNLDRMSRRNPVTPHWVHDDPAPSAEQVARVYPPVK